VLPKNLVCFLKVLSKRGLIFEQIQKIRVVHLEEHASQLASISGVVRKDERVQEVSQNLLLVFGLSRGKLIQKLLADWMRR
jgi:hypothetical protein